MKWTKFFTRWEVKFGAIWRCLFRQYSEMNHTHRLHIRRYCFMWRMSSRMASLKLMEFFFSCTLPLKSLSRRWMYWGILLPDCRQTSPELSMCCGVRSNHTGTCLHCQSFQWSSSVQVGVSMHHTRPCSCARYSQSHWFWRCSWDAPGGVVDRRIIHRA